MHIAVDARMIRSSGIGTFLRNILQRIVSARPDWNLFLLGNTVELHEIDALQKKNVAMIDCRAPIYSIREQLELPLKTPSNIEVFWSPHFNVPIFYNGALVSTIHDVAHLAVPGITDTMAKKLYADFMYRMAVKKSAKVTCVSKFTMHEVEKYIGAKADHMRLIYNAADASWFQIKAGKRMHERPYFIYVGNIKPHKNLRRLILAYKKAERDLREDLILVGKKDGFIGGEDGIEDLLQGFEDRIRFTGYVSDTDLQQYIVQSEGLVLLSLYEGFGLPPLEAMAAGRKALVSDIPVFHEVYGDCVMYCDPYDVQTIAKSLRTFAKTSFDKRRLQEKAAAYSWERTAQKFIEILEEVNAMRVARLI